MGASSPHPFPMGLFHTHMLAKIISTYTRHQSTVLRDSAELIPGLHRQLSYFMASFVRYAEQCSAFIFHLRFFQNAAGATVIDSISTGPAPPRPTPLRAGKVPRKWQVFRQDQNDKWDEQVIISGAGRRGIVYSGKKWRYVAGAPARGSWEDWWQKRDKM